MVRVFAGGRRALREIGGDQGQYASLLPHHKLFEEIVRIYVRWVHPRGLPSVDNHICEMGSGRAWRPTHY